MLATVLLALPASAQTIAYINLLQFDLHSFRSQATGGIFQDDVDNVGNAARLLQVEGDRLYTNFSNLNDDATLGDALITYDATVPGNVEIPSHFGNPTSVDHFDTGSFLTGWIGKYADDSEYVFSGFVQRNGGKTMFENLEDGVIGGGSPSSGPGTSSGLDAEFTGTSVSTTYNPADNSITADETTTIDLLNFDERSAWNWDIGGARGISEDLDVGGRLFFKRDRLDRNRGGTTTIQTRALDGGSGQLEVTNTTTTEFFGTGDNAFKFSEIGVSMNADYHAWSDQAFNVRLDIYGVDMTNPSPGLAVASSFAGSGSVDEREDPVGVDVNAAQRTERTPVEGAQAGGLGTLLSARENVSTRLTRNSSFGAALGAGTLPLATTSIDDSRDGVGVNFLMEYDRGWAGGDTRTWAGIARRPFDLNATEVRRASETDEFWWNDGTADRLATANVQNDTATIRREGDMTHTTLEGGTRYWRELSRRVNVGLGAILTRSKWTEKYSQTETSVQATGFEDGDGDSNVNVLLTQSGNPLFNEFTQTITSTSVTDFDDQLENTTVRFPVGSQFRFGNWTWNMGLTHAVINAKRETVKTVPAGGDGRTVTIRKDRGAGTEVTTYGTSGTTGTGTVIDRNTWNQTTYWYGLEWLFADAARININGLFDTHSDGSSSEREIIDVDFFKNLAMSITFLLD
jgi:hypothetical protein